MENALLNLAASQGIWVLLFVSLFIYTIKRYERMEKQQELREKEYQNLVNNLTENLYILSTIKDDITEIKTKLNENTP